jgi:hypothetical protein
MSARGAGDLGKFMKRIIASAAFAAVVGFAVLICGEVANATTYTLVNIVCGTENCSMMGSFDYNGSFSNIDITMTGTVFHGSVFSTDQGSTATQLYIGDGSVDYWVLNFALPLPVSGGTDAITSGCGFSTIDVPPNPFVCTLPSILATFELTGSVDSSVSATPLPAALPLFATGFGALGLLGWRKKRKVLAAK